MTNKLLYGKPISSYDNEEDIDYILSKLTVEEIRELNEDLDPDNTLLPASQRCKDQTIKLPTGVFNRDALIKFLFEKAKNELDWSEIVPFQKLTRGKVFVDKNHEKTIEDELFGLGFDTNFDEEANEVIRNASEDELVELAAILGFTGLLNQVQYHAGFNGKQKCSGGFQSIAKSEPCKVFESDNTNSIDIDQSIVSLKNNCSQLTILNLNNIKLSNDEIIKLSTSLMRNEFLEELYMSSSGLCTTNFNHILISLAQNCSLRVVNFESNFLKGRDMVEIFKAINRPNSKLIELQLVNQRCQTLGIQIEQQLTQLILSNQKLMRVSIDFKTQDARIRINEHLKNNVDRHTRLTRVELLVNTITEPLVELQSNFH